MEPTYLVRIQPLGIVIAGVGIPQGCRVGTVAVFGGAFAYGVRRVLRCCRSMRPKRTVLSGAETLGCGGWLVLPDFVEMRVFRAGL